MKNSINLPIYVPYITFDRITFCYRKRIPLKKIEAIVVSFIYASQQQKTNISKEFISLYNEKFNLEDKWNNFTYDILQNLYDSKVLEFDIKQLHNKLLIDDITINKQVENYIKKKEFYGMDDKDIDVKELINIALFRSLVPDDKYITNMKMDQIDDSELNQNLLNVSKDYVYDNTLDEIAVDKIVIKSSQKTESILESKKMIYKNIFLIQKFILK